MPRRGQQLGFASWNLPKHTPFGGDLLKGNPKKARPVVTNRAMHVILRSSLATGSRSFLKDARGIERLIRHQARSLGIVVYDLANAGNHIHLILKLQQREDLGRFLRAVGGLIARKVLGAEKNSPSKLERSFWDKRPYSRIINGDFTQLRGYLAMNKLETQGLTRDQAKRVLRTTTARGRPPPS